VPDKVLLLCRHILAWLQQASLGLRCGHVFYLDLDVEIPVFAMVKCDSIMFDQKSTAILEAFLELPPDSASISS
jgi:hypothetical protein